MITALCTCCLQNQTPVGALLCSSCSARLAVIALHPTEEFPQNSVVSLYKYRKPLTKMIHRAKIRDDIPALRALTYLLASAPVSLTRAAWATHIMPAPSSLWGRLRGRYDIAWLAADTLARHAHKPLLEPPRHLYWRLRKQARLAPGKRSALRTPAPETAIPTSSTFTSSNPDAPSSRTPAHLLIIDDVVTTGDTLRRLQSVLRRLYPNCQIKCLTLARAGST